MDTDEFWKIISFTNQEALEECDEEGALESILEILSSKTVEEIDQFQEYLSQVLYAIDGQKWLDESGESSNSGDGFLYARCYVVAKGQDYYSKVLNDPSLMPKSSDQWAESLLYVASQAWAEITGNDEEDYDRESSVSYESFSNKAQW